MHCFELTTIDVHTLPQLREAEFRQVEFDLTYVGFIRPVNAVALIARVGLFAEFGFDVFVKAPANLDIARYASRLRIPELIRDVGGIPDGFPLITPSYIPSRILEVQQFSNSADLEILADQIGAHVTDEATLNGLRHCLFEAGENVYQHSGKNQGFLAAQFYEREGRYRFAIGDNGMGLRAALANTHAPGDDAEAIDLAVERGVSGTFSATRGKGLHNVRKIVTGQGGWLSLTSGQTTKIFVDPVETPDSYRIGDHVPGTILEGCLRSKYGRHGQ